MVPRGIRNNNPLNIKRGCNWEGLKKRSQCTDFVFAEFVHPKYGWRAAALLLSRYFLKRGLNTIYRIVERWCSDGNVKVYASFVAASCRSKLKSVDFDVFTVIDERMFVGLLETILLTMAQFECGKDAVLDFAESDDLRFALLSVQVVYFYNYEIKDFYNYGIEEC